MNALLHRLWQRLLRRIGVQGLIGTALLAAAAALAAWTPSLTRQAQALREATEARSARMQTQHARLPQGTTQEQLRRFSATFPTPDRNADDLKRVFDAARRSDVSLIKGEYQIVAETNSPFVTYSLTFPVHESYAAIKKFTAEVLRSLPHAEMDELRLERANAGATTLDARIRISLIYRAS